METKVFPFEVKSVDEDGTFEGYCAIFDKPDNMGEIVEKGAFTKTLKEGGNTRPMCWYHDPKIPLGLVELEEDNKGLKTRGKFDLNVQEAREKHSLMKMKAIRGLSFAFNTVKDVWDKGYRRIKEVKLFEAGPCTFQAHPNALVTNVKNLPWDESKPYPNEHSARLVDPGKFDKFKRTKGGKLYNKITVPATISIIWGHLEGEGEDDWAAQALRFPTESWSAEKAKAWLKSNEVKYQNFEAASKSLEGALEFLEEFKVMETKGGKMIPAANLKSINDAIKALTAILENSEPSDDTRDEGKGILSPIIKALELKDKPQSHLSGIIKALENQTQE